MSLQSQTIEALWLEVQFMLIFLDLMLDGHDGVDVINLMHEHSVQTPIVICSGMDPSIVASTLDLLRENKLAYAGTLAKPFTLEQFQQALTFTPQAFESEQPADANKSDPALLAHDIKVAIKLGWFKSVFQPQRCFFLSSRGVLQLPKVFYRSQRCFPDPKDVL